MDNGDFRTAVNGKVKKIGEAFAAFYDNEGIKSIVEIHKPEWEKALLRMGGSEPSAAGKASTALGKGRLDFRKIVVGDKESLVQALRDDIESWHGAAKLSFDNYLNEVDNALKVQLECLNLLMGFLDIQAGLIDAGHEYALEIADKTVAAITTAAAAEERAEREELGRIITAVAAGIGGVVSGGVLVGAITAIGGVSAAVAATPEGADPIDIIDGMYGEIDKAVSTMNRDREDLGDAMRKSRDLYFGDDFSLILPPAVNLVET